MRAVGAATLIVVATIAPGCGSKGPAVFPGADAVWRVAASLTCPAIGCPATFGGTTQPMRATGGDSTPGAARSVPACSFLRGRPERPHRLRQRRSRGEMERSRRRRTARGFVRDLRAGRFTNDTPPGGFVLLLQEAVRGGAAVPPTVPDDAPVPDRIQIASPSGNLDDVVSVAEHQGLALLYLPSMRNGRDDNARAEDGGNAILSTFNLSEPTGISPLHASAPGRNCRDSGGRGTSAASMALARRQRSPGRDHRPTSTLALHERAPGTAGRTSPGCARR